jgi:hypothetical protein
MNEEKEPDITVIHYENMEPFRQRMLHFLWFIIGCAIGVAATWILKG